VRGFNLTLMFETQRSRLFLWIPVLFGAGIGIYFALPYEPKPIELLLIALCAGFCSYWGWKRHDFWGAGVLALVLLSFGYSYAGFRTKTIAAPVLSKPYYGAIEGRVVQIDRSSSNAVRVTLDRLYLPGISAKKTPARVRISLRGIIPDEVILPGARIIMTGRISPPGAPVEPQGFDFRRMAWFMQLGGVGYTRNPVLLAAEADIDSLSMRIFSWRLAISQVIQHHIPGQNGAFAAAIITGDRANINPEILANLRITNLAHLLAISGLHMGLLSGFVFALLRYGIALVPVLSLRVQSKKIAAALAICVGLAYLLLSGANVATQRAFIMTFVVLLAVILDRSAFTLRAVALAALLVLLIRPNSLLGAGFQMSFAATTALIAVYEWMRAVPFWQAMNNGRWRFLKPLIALVLTSGVAGLATAPFSMFHFNQMSQFGLIANLMAVPIMGLLVMPFAVVAALLYPFGGTAIALFIMGKAVGAILAVSNNIAQLEGAARAVKSGPTIVLALIALGGVWLFLWRGRGKILGLAILAVAAMIWFQTPRPTLFISENGRIFGALENTRRVISKARGNGYGVRIWLENDGDRVDQAAASMRKGVIRQGKLGYFTFENGWRIALYTGKNLLDIEGICDEKTILVSIHVMPDGACLKIDQAYLDRSGALSVNFENGNPQLISSRETAKNRPWGY